MNTIYYTSEFPFNSRTLALYQELIRREIIVAIISGQSIEFFERPMKYIDNIEKYLNRNIRITSITYDNLGKGFPLLSSPNKYGLSRESKKDVFKYRINKYFSPSIYKKWKLASVGNGKYTFQLSTDWGRWTHHIDFKNTLFMAYLELMAEQESIFLDQHFIPYLDFFQIYRELGLVNQLITQGIYNGDVMDRDKLLINHLPERLALLYWKKYLRDWCEFSSLNKKETASDVFKKVLYRSQAKDVLARANSYFEEDDLADMIKKEIWKSYWNSKDFFFTFKDNEGLTQKAIIHAHELTIAKTPTSLYIKPTDYFKDQIEEIVQVKKKIYESKAPFLALDFDNLIGKEKIIPIDNVSKLFREGLTMIHCISGEEYITAGLDHKFLYFRFIPTTANRNDPKEHLTVTMINSRETETHFRGKITAIVNEVWGYENRCPSEHELMELDCFIHDNQDQFDMIFRPV